MPLALKYRPRKFSDLSGQEHVCIVIKAILSRYRRGIEAGGEHSGLEYRLPAGFLLSGSRGTGKTTVARIIAASLNCLSTNQQESGSDCDPCGTCSNCTSVWNSTCLFVHEVDAASNSGVDNVRSLKTIAQLEHGGRTRVIILDEAHSLTSASFEALLKVLEEPPSNTLFVFATTEPETIPETVLSRLMQFDFKRITPEFIQLRLSQICSIENIDITSSVLRAISNRATGGMRDAIMMLEQLSYYKQPLTLQDFREYYGLVGDNVSIEFIQAAKSADIVKAKQIINESFSRGVDIESFLDDFLRLISRDVMSAGLNDNDAVEVYRATIEVKSRIKYITSDTAIHYLFTLLLKALHTSNGRQVVQEASSEDIKALFNVGNI